MNKLRIALEKIVNSPFASKEAIINCAIEALNKENLVNENNSVSQQNITTTLLNKETKINFASLTSNELFLYLSGVEYGRSEALSTEVTEPRMFSEDELRELVQQLRNAISCIHHSLTAVWDDDIPKQEWKRLRSEYPVFLKPYIEKADDFIQSLSPKEGKEEDCEYNQNKQDAKELVYGEERMKLYRPSLEPNQTEAEKEVVYELQFANHVQASIVVSNNTLKVRGAINGYGDGISLDEIKIFKNEPLFENSGENLKTDKDVTLADEIMWQHISKEPIDIKREGLIDAPIWKAHLNAMEEYASLARNQVIEEMEEWANRNQKFPTDSIYIKDILVKLSELKK